MKPENIEPEEGKFNWEDADKLVKFAEDTQLKRHRSRPCMAQSDSPVDV